MKATQSTLGTSLTTFEFLPSLSARLAIVFFTFWLSLMIVHMFIFEFHPSYIKLEPSQIFQTAPVTMLKEEDQLLNRLAQFPFNYLGKGNQSFVFESFDKKHVLKLFKFEHLQVTPYESLLFPKQQRVKIKKIQRLFEAHYTAYTYDKDNTFLTYLHLHPTHQLPTITCVDRWGRNHLINLNKTYFVIQKKGKTLRDTLGPLLKTQRVSEALSHLHQLLDMYLAEYQKHIIDRDHNLIHNTGFIEGKPFRLDVGKISLDPHISSHYQEDLNKIINIRLARWLKKYYPDYEKTIIEDLNRSYLFKNSN